MCIRDRRELAHALFLGFYRTFTRRMLEVRRLHSDPGSVRREWLTYADFKSAQSPPRNGGAHPKLAVGASPPRHVMPKLA